MTQHHFWTRAVATASAAALAAGLLTAAAPPTDDGDVISVAPRVEDTVSPGSSWIVGVEPGTAQDVADDWIARGYQALALESYVSITAPATLRGAAATATATIASDSRITHVVANEAGVPASWDDAFNQINVKPWHQAKGDGSGVKVAIIDVGFANWQDARSEGKLPANVTTVDTCAQTSFTDNRHGTAVAEVVHQVSPKAQLALVCASYVADLIDAVEWVVNNKYDVIQMSVNWYGPDSRVNGTGILVDIADWAQSYGVIWINSAANAAAGHYGGTFNPGPNGWHLWEGSDQGNQILVPEGVSRFHVRWDEEYPANDHYELCASTSNTVPPGPEAICSDYHEWWEGWMTEHYPDDPIVYPAYEELLIGREGAPVTQYLWLRRLSGTGNPTITVTTDPGTPITMEHVNGVSSVMGPADAASVIAVGAYDYHTMTMAPYSSQGPTFDGRMKPDLVAPSHLPSSLYDEPVGFNGTSAAAPVVSGVAANMLSSGYAQNLTPAEFREVLLEEFTVNTGFTPNDNPNISGVGRVRMISNPKPFPDVDIKNAFIRDIRWLKDVGLTTGYQDGTFGATGTVSRQAMSAFLYRFEGEPEYTPTFTFVDVASTHPFAVEIGWLAAAEISTGYSDGTFRGGANVSRQAMAAFLHRFLGSPEITLPSKPSFKDVPTSHVFYAEIEWLASTGITSGYSDGTFRGGANVSRQAMAAFLHRASTLLLE